MAGFFVSKADVAPKFLATAIPIVHRIASILVVRDDLFPGGTKARFMPICYEAADEVVYASPAQGGAQTALAYTAAQLGKKATIFVAKRSKWHPRTQMAKKLGAKIVEVDMGYLTVVQARARAYCEETGACLAPFGFDMPEGLTVIADAARRLGINPDEVWCAASSGTLARGLSLAWPKAKLRVVQVGRRLKGPEVNNAEVFVWPKPYNSTGPQAEFPLDPHYESKAWDVCKANKGLGSVLFWNVTGPAD